MSRRALATALVSAALLVAGAGCGADAQHDTQQNVQHNGQHNGVDVDFAQDMVPHHRQALEMVAIAKQKTGLDPAVRDLVTQIGAAQGPEVATMTRWLKGWGEDVPDGDAADMAMRGMLSSDELDQLRDADGAAFQRLWLQDMVHHHQGAIPMAQTEIDGGKSAEAIDLAHGIVETQKAEIDQMTALVGH